MQSILQTQLRVVLVETSHPGNIGAAARAMKTMGVSQLILVNPKKFPDPKATEMASGADDLLGKVQVVATLEEALLDCVLVIGTSARSRSLPWPMLSPKDCAQVVLRSAHQENQVALVFGRERTGLTNPELQLCHYHVQIPANPEYSSLNLAQAVQVLVYECYSASLKEHEYNQDEEWDWVTSQEQTKFYDILEETLLQMGFLNPKAPRQLMPRLRRLFNRARLERMELNILRGILARCQELARHEKTDLL